MTLDDDELPGYWSTAGQERERQDLLEWEQDWIEWDMRAEKWPATPHCWNSRFAQAPAERADSQSDKGSGGLRGDNLAASAPEISEEEA